MPARRALVVWGGWDGHEPEQGAAVVAGLLREDGFEVRVEADIEAFADPAIAGCSLIVPVITRARISVAALANLVAAVQGGAGLAGYHGGLVASFREPFAFHFMCGGQLVGHPGGIIRYRVSVTQPDDPVMAGIGDFDYVSEQYYLHVDPAVQVLATTTFTGAHAPWTQGVVMPVAWKKRYGAGRVFYSALGHVAAELERPQPRAMLRRGLLWAAR
jgi:type 1 glutamine amidotransferase